MFNFDSSLQGSLGRRGEKASSLKKNLRRLRSGGMDVGWTGNVARFENPNEPLPAFLAVPAGHLGTVLGTDRGQSADKRKTESNYPALKQFL